MIRENLEQSQLKLNKKHLEVRKRIRLDNCLEDYRKFVFDFLLPNFVYNRLTEKTVYEKKILSLVASPRLFLEIKKWIGGYTTHDYIKNDKIVICNNYLLVDNRLPDDELAIIYHSSLNFIERLLLCDKIVVK